jgi:ABC-type sugar transport system ATPase subunit
VHQELNLLADRTVAENVYLGREPVRRGQVDRKRMESDTADLLDRLGEHGITPRTPVRRLPVAQRQVVEIVKALSMDARVIAMDEPTAALADHEVELLYDLVDRLRTNQIAVLYVSHRLREVFDLSQRITVLKDGLRVTTTKTDEITADQLVRAMVGRPLDAMFPDRATTRGAVRLAIRDGGNNRLREINLELYAGEIVGLAGLQGSGRSAVARAICGVDPLNTGEFEVDGQLVSIRSPRAAIRHGIAHVTEDRKGEGLALQQTVRDNTMLVRNAAFGRKRIDVEQLLRSVQLKSKGTEQEVRYLSGGNQQKVVLAKWLAVQPIVLVADEPTRGIDVGRIAGELPAEPTEEAVMALATGGTA